MQNYQTEDNLHQYMQEVGAIPMLSAEEEHALAVSASAGDQLAEQKLVEANLRLVISIAKKYDKPGMPLADRIQAGNIGLMKAAAKFDPERDNRFSTYANYWIRQSIEREAINTGKLIRPPAHIVERTSKMKQIQAEYIEKFERMPTVDELSDLMNLSIKQIKSLLACPADPISLNATIKNQKEESETEVMDFIENSRSADPVLLAEDDALRNDIQLALQKLSDRNRAILCDRLGFDGHDPMTLEEIGAAYGLSRERVRQIYNASLKTLRNSSAAAQLQDYLSA